MGEGKVEEQNEKVSTCSELKVNIRTSLTVQWLRLCVSTAGGMGLIPSWGTKIPHASRCGQKELKN